VSNSILPDQLLASRLDVAIGARLNLRRIRGTEHAKLLWFVVLSHTPWETLSRPTWANNETLTHELGLTDRRDTERAMGQLRHAGMLSTPEGERPGARRKIGRLLVPRLGSPAKVIIPDREAMTQLWSLCREVRCRPASLVTTVVGMYALACHAQDREIFEWAPVPGRLADHRRFVGARKNSAWTERVRDLERLGVIKRVGREVWISPASTWDRSARAIEAHRPVLRVVEAVEEIFDEPPFRLAVA